MAQIKNEAAYRVALQRIDELLPLVNDETPTSDKNYIELDMLSDMVEEYEEKHYPIQTPSLVDTLRLRMYEMGLTQAKLADMLGISCARISEIIAGKGEPGTNGGPRGDLLVEVRVAANPKFERVDFDVYSEVPISFATAALGGEIKIETIDGAVMYDVKPGTQSHTKVRLRGKGFPTIRNKQVRGDHYVTLVVKVPEKMNETQKEALRAFDEAMNGGNPSSEGKKKKGLFGK